MHSTSQRTVTVNCLRKIKLLSDARQYVHNDATGVPHRSLEGPGARVHAIPTHASGETFTLTVERIELIAYKM